MKRPPKKYHINEIYNVVGGMYNVPDGGVV